jgi:hypothetical protein
LKLNRIEYIFFRYTFTILLCVVSLNIVIAQIYIDYTSIVTVAGSTSDYPTHYAYGTLGPFTAYNKVWIFFSDGEYAVWKTKNINQGGGWEDGGYVFDVPLARNFNVAFDGQHFHFIRVVDGDLKYLRGKAQQDGSIHFDPEVTAFSDPIWKVQTVNFEDLVIAPRHFAITADNNNLPWIIVKVGDGNVPDANFKPIALSSIAEDGNWLSRSGFPVDLAPAYNAWQNGRASSVIEVDEGKILFTWGNYRKNEVDPQRGFRARLWSNEILGPIENTGLTWHTASTSVVVPSPGVAMLNSQTEVARRNSDGTWTRVDPGGMVDWTDYNSLSAFGNIVRLWDYSNGYIRYKQTNNNGDTWSSIVQKWPSSNILHFSASHDGGSQGNHHSLLWSEGTNPYDVVMAIEGDYEPVPVLAAPALATPLNNATNVPAEVLFTWNESVGANSYRIQIALDSGFNDIVEDESDLPDNEYILLLDYLTEYYWRVNALNEDGPSGWSDMRSFTTVIEKPEVPLLVSPVNDAENVSVTAILDWNESERAETYHVQVSTSTDFESNTIDEGGIAESQFLLNGVSGGTQYHWRVLAENPGGFSDWSEVWTFTTIEQLPDMPLLVSPENGSTDRAINITFEWETSLRAEFYRFQISTQAGFGSLVFDTTGVVETELSHNGLNYGTQYYWRVQAGNNDGVSEWSDAWSFTTAMQVPAVPVLAYPRNGATNIATDTLLVWESAARAQTYHVQVSEDSAFSAAIVDSNGLSNTFLSINGLDSVTTYFWRVRALNPAGESDWSSIWNFTTGNITIVDSLDRTVPRHYSLSQNYPNPFNPSTTIQYTIPSDVHVRLTVYNVLGQVVAELVNESQRAGSYDVTLNAVNLPSGIYIYHLTAGNFIETRRMILAK